MNDFVGDDPESVSSRKSRLAGEIVDLLDTLSPWMNEHKLDAISPEGLITDLKPHQKISAGFITHRETTQFLNQLCQEFERIFETNPSFQPSTFGGIIADVMGLGKTLAMLATIAMTLPRAGSFAASSQPEAHGTAICRTKATLVIVPSSQLVDVWKAEIAQHFSPGTLNTYTFHGQRREHDTGKLGKYDIVLTTYATLASDGQSHHLLRQLEWYRIVLDEAHWIRNSTSKQFRAAATLSGRSRWCLTGTPIQNKLDDLISLAEFLRLPPLRNRRQFDTLILTPLSTGVLDAAKVLKHYLETFCLRRGQACLDLPPSRTVDIDLEPSEAEWVDYRRVLEEAKRKIDGTVSKRGNAKFSILFTMIVKLRRLCNLGNLATEGVGTLRVDTNELETGCDLCNAADEDTRLFLGSYQFCPQCSFTLQPASPLLEMDVDTPSNQTTPTSSALGFRSSPYQHEFAPETSAPRGTTSTKLSAVLNNILHDESGSKHIVFSYWTAALDALAAILSAAGVTGIAQIDGRVNYTERLSRLDAFRDIKGSVSVLLMTIGTGAVGLNLTAANRVHIIEPQWSPATEDQAIGRAVRMGQQREVVIYKYLLRGTVEQNIRNLQAKKKELAKVAFDSDSRDGLDEKLAELRFILDI